MMRRPLWIAFFVAILAVAGGTAVHHTMLKGSAVTTVRIGTFSTAIDYSPYYVAKSQGWLDQAAQKNGVKIEYLRFDALPSINDAIAAKKLDIILEADTPAIIQQAAGNDLIAIAPLGSLAQEVIIPASSTARTLADLKGKRLGVLFGSGFHFGVVKGMSESGVATGAITLVNLAPAEAQGALSGGTIDAWSVWPPFPQQEVLAGRGKVIPGGGARVNVLMFGSAEFVKQQSNLTKDLVAAIDRARTYMAANTKATHSLVAQETGLPIDVVVAAWPKIDFNLALGPSVIAGMNDQSEFLFRGGFIAKKVQFQPSFLYAGGR